MGRPRQAEIVVTLDAVDNGGTFDSHNLLAYLKVLCRRYFERTFGSGWVGSAGRAGWSMFAVHRFGYSAAASYGWRSSSIGVGGE